MIGVQIELASGEAHAEHGPQLAGSMQLRNPARWRKAVRAVLWMRHRKQRRTVEV